MSCPYDQTLVPECQSIHFVGRCLGLRLSPDFARGIHHKLKFLPLLVHG